MIDIQYTLEENDFLQLNLYFFKTDGKLKRVIYRSFIAYLLIIFILCVFFIWENEYLPAIILIVISGILSVFHTRRMKNIYLKMFKKNIKNYETRFNKEVQLKVSDTFIEIKSVSGEFNFNLSEIDSISETNEYFIIKLKIEAIIIPKKRLHDLNLLKESLVQLSKKLNIEFITNLNWKW